MQSRSDLADLGAEGGGFRGEAKGMVHHGFERKTFGHWLHDACFVDVQFSTELTVQREDGEAIKHEYPIFWRLRASRLLSMRT